MGSLSSDRSKIMSLRARLRTMGVWLKDSPLEGLITQKETRCLLGHALKEKKKRVTKMIAEEEEVATIITSQTIMASNLAGEDRMKSLKERQIATMLPKEEQILDKMRTVRWKTSSQFTSKKAKLISKNVTCSLNAELLSFATQDQIPHCSKIESVDPSEAV